MSATISSSTPIAEAFARCRAESRAALVLYTTAGHPTRDEGIEVLNALAEAGTDVVELGVPFSDPLADGPTIQRSSYDAIAQGVDLRWTLELLARFRARHSTPVVLFSYLNPILNYGVERFLADAVSAGAQGVLLTDLPVGADPELESSIRTSPLDLIRLIAPTTSPSRALEIAATAEGFLYYISRTGVTGAQEGGLAENLESEVEEVKRSSTVPVAVGFGISSPEEASQVARVADGVVVGSALVQALGRGGVREGYRFAAALRRAMERTGGGTG